MRAAALDASRADDAARVGPTQDGIAHAEIVRATAVRRGGTRMPDTGTESARRAYLI